MKSFLDALQASREIDFKNTTAVSLGNIGVLQSLDGRASAALASFDEALGILKGLGDSRGLAEFTLKQAGVLHEVGRDADAKRKLDESEALVGATRNREQSADRLALLGEWHARQGRRQDAQDAFAQAAEHAAASHSRIAILRVRVARGAALEASTAGASQLAAVLREAETVGDALLQMRAAEALGRAEQALGRTLEAERAAALALRAAERSGWYAGLYRLHALHGRILENKGDAAGATRAWRESARRLAELRERLGAEARAAFDALPSAHEVDAWMAAHPEQATTR
jgi:tetratricopeptide (TPR) repeat protein